MSYCKLCNREIPEYLNICEFCHLKEKINELSRKIEDNLEKTGGDVNPQEIESLFKKEKIPLPQKIDISLEDASLKRFFYEEQYSNLSIEERKKLLEENKISKWQIKLFNRLFEITSRLNRGDFHIPSSLFFDVDELKEGGEREMIGIVLEIEDVKERNLIRKSLDNPSHFPREYLSFLKSFIEGVE